ncbi:hypothetical protein J4434_00100 [Candidatus Woesearchaeota archaeon]|nr:hypothetical protein [Candidatus Woesearchaeota archaeon]
MDVFCKNCKSQMKPQGRIMFGNSWYNQFKCISCNNDEFMIIEKDLFEESLF